MQLRMGRTFYKRNQCCITTRGLQFRISSHEPPADWSASAGRLLPYPRLPQSGIFPRDCLDSPAWPSPTVPFPSSAPCRGFLVRSRERSPWCRALGRGRTGGSPSARVPARPSCNRARSPECIPRKNAFPGLAIYSENISQRLSGSMKETSQAETATYARRKRFCLSISQAEAKSRTHCKLEFWTKANSNRISIFVHGLPLPIWSFSLVFE